MHTLRHQQTPTSPKREEGGVEKLFLFHLQLFDAPPPQKKKKKKKKHV